MQLIKVDSGITLNEYPGALAQHRRFAAYYDLTETDWNKDREQRILDVGLAEAYKKSRLEDRILSTDTVRIPEHDVIELQNNNGTGQEGAAANGHAPSGPSDNGPPDPG